MYMIRRGDDAFIDSSITKGYKVDCLKWATKTLKCYQQQSIELGQKCFVRGAKTAVKTISKLCSKILNKPFGLPSYIGMRDVYPNTVIVMLI